MDRKRGGEMINIKTKILAGLACICLILTAFF